jgi:putative transposase
MQSIKGKSSRKMMSEFRNLSKVFWGRHIWGRGYFAASSGNVTDKVIVQHIELQGEEPEDGDFRIEGEL